MKLSEFKSNLNKLNEVNFFQPDGKAVPHHFHITEVGITTKNFIDCGGTIREEKVVNFQLWQANDFDHRLSPEKLLKIIALSEKALVSGDHEVEVEYQSNTIGRYGVEFKDGAFILTAKNTNCLASDSCGIKEIDKLIPEGAASNACCSSGGGCC
jgi:hypothetical protein